MPHHVVMAWVYIVECSDGSHYTGSTIDLERRLWEHNEGLGSNFTKRRRPVKLAFAEQSDSIEASGTGPRALRQAQGPGL